MKKIERLIVYPLLLALLVLFSFFDLPSMQALYDQTNLFGRLGETLGEVPFQLLCVYCSFLLFRFRRKDSRKANYVYGALFLLFALAFAGYGGAMVHSYLSEPTFGMGSPLWVVFPVSAAYLLIGGFLAKITPVSSPERAVAFSVFALLFYLAILLAMNLFKFVWARPRWRYLDAAYGEDAAAHFVPWYLPRGSGEVSSGSFNDFASFPSGHTMNALGVILFSLSPSFLSGCKGKETLIRIAAYFWAGLVGVSRIVMGAHFGSDVVAGFLIALAMFDLASTFLWPRWQSRFERRRPPTGQTN